MGSEQSTHNREANTIQQCELAYDDPFFEWTTPEIEEHLAILTNDDILELQRHVDYLMLSHDRNRILALRFKYLINRWHELNTSHKKVSLTESKALERIQHHEDYDQNSGEMNILTDFHRLYIHLPLFDLVINKGKDHVLKKTNFSYQLEAEHHELLSMIEKDRLEQNKLYCDGEEIALQGKDIVNYKCHYSTIFTMQKEALLYRLVESKFSVPGVNSTIKELTYIVNPTLYKRWKAVKKEYAERHGFLLESMKPYMLFHGTSDANMKSITTKGFLKSKIGSTTDRGYYGFGHYFVENPDYSSGYSRNKKLLGCLIYVGKAKALQSVQLGCALTKGYDSHISGCGSEVVIFDDRAILPCFIISFTR